ncbi:hypothetical protein [Pseudescherichia sp.]|uniref:hypothetical protein n=1 Tax=Pseudescherichia sp. TaxID=2055881 RepID=UPI0028A5A7EC|nr:hypothetical protein [Pseudescherichia sp.]
MTFSLSAIASALSVAASVVQSSEVIFKAGAELIQVAEDAYTHATGTGATKKAAVLAALKAFAEDIGQNWDELKDEVSSWIDMVVQSWNKLKALSAGTAVVDTTTEAGTVAAA